MRFFGRKKQEAPALSREDSLSARPVLHRLVRVERADNGAIILRVPRRSTPLVRAVSRVFKLPPYRSMSLDELGTFVIEMCDGTHTVDNIVDKFTKKYKLNRREAELSMLAFLRTLARRSIVALIVGEAN